MDKNYILEVVNVNGIGEVVCARGLSFHGASDDLPEILEEIKTNFSHIKVGLLDNSLSHGLTAYNRFMLFDTDCNYFTIKLRPVTLEDENRQTLHEQFIESCVKNNINISYGLLNSAELFIVKKQIEKLKQERDMI